MTQEEKDLLLKDLSGRQTHNVKCQVFNDAKPYTLSGVLHNKPYSQLYFEELDWKEHDGFVGVEYCKPYLFPLSSMTEEQKDEFDRLYTYDALIVEPQWKLIDFCNKHNLDYRGLIPMGLAIDATDKNIY
jgi:hypothetical protein